MSRTEHAVNEIRLSKECARETNHDAQVSDDADCWIPISPEITEMAMLSYDMDPKLWKEVMAAYDAAEWMEGLKEEMESLRTHDVFTLVPKSSIPVGHRIVKSRPHCHRKHDERGEVVRCKVRVVAKGFTQVPGVDFGETYAPVTQLESIRTVLHIGATNDWDIDHLDVKTAFLHGELDEEIYMEQPEGVKEPGKEDWICRLNKSLYGLCQAS